MSTNQTANNNVAVGYNALRIVTTGNHVAVGYNALNSNVSGTNNTALGYGALLFSTGSENTAVGYVAGQPYSATSIGYSSNQTTAVGTSATVIANQATAIGYAATASGINSTAVGNGAPSISANTIQLGNSSVTNVSTNGTVTSNSTVLTSDVRLKKNIQPLTNALGRIRELNPVSYDKKRNLISNDYTIHENGFIAQELRKVLPDLVSESNDKDKILTVNYLAIIPLLTKALQEQDEKIISLEKKLQELASQKKNSLNFS